jgi:ribokinase
MSDRPLVVIGSLNLDRTFHVWALPAAGVTQTVLVYQEGVGGKGANQAAAAARMGARTHMLGCRGADAAGELIASTLSAAGVDIGSLVRTGSAPTGNAAILVTPDGQNSILVVPGANHLLAPEHLRAQRELLARASMLVLQMETPLAVLAEALTFGVPVMLDPAPAAALPAELMRQLTWFTPNESEARFYLESTGGDAALAEGDGEELCRYFQALGPRNVLLKQGERGAALLTSSGSFFEVAAPRVAVVDTTGAGDTLNGALAAALNRGANEQEALHFAVAAASLSTTRRGALASLPDRDEVDRLLARE